MDKIYTYWKKVILAAALIAAVGSVGAPKGALAASWLDGLLDMPNSYGSFDITPTGNSTPKIDIFGDYQLAFQHFAANGSGTYFTCAQNAKSHWDTYKNGSQFRDYAIQIEDNGVGSGQYRVAWYFGNIASKTHSFTQQNGNTSGYGALLNNAGNNWQYMIGFSVASSDLSGGYMESTTTPGQYIGITCSSGTNTAAGQGKFRGTMEGSNAYGSYVLYSKNIPVTYPSGYVGSPLRTEYVPPILPLTDTPKIVLRSVNDWKGQFSDDNFLTFDDVPFTCDGGLAPVIRGEVWDERVSPVLLDTFEASATGLFNITFPQDNSDSDYRIVAWYVCDDGINVFSDSSHYTFTITGYGQLKNEDLFYACVDTDFPFLHLEDCLENMFTVINMLSFGDANFGGNWSSPEGCYTLTYIDDWINRPGQIVCPAVKSTVRALMTPVVLFLLALAMVRVINRHNERRP